MSVVVCLSGGVDSTVLAAKALQTHTKVTGVFVDYGQPVAGQEWHAASQWCQQHGVPLRRYAIETDALLGGVMRAGSGMGGPRVVPGRNALLLSFAVSTAVEVGVPEVQYGATADDHEEYPDCRVRFVEYFDRMSVLAYRVSIRTPLIRLHKPEIVQLGRELGVDLDTTWSCYESRDGRPCGTCNACVTRDRALA